MESAGTNQPESTQARSQVPDQRSSAERVSTVRRLNGRFVVVSLLVLVACGAVVHLVHGFVVESNAEQLLTRANDAEQEGREDDAIRLLTQYLKLQLANHADDEELASESGESLTELYVRLGGMIFDQTPAKDRRVERDRMMRIYRIYEEVLRRDPERWEIRRRLVDVSISFRQVGDALEHIEELIDQTDPDDQSTLAELQMLQGQCNWLLGNHDDAQTQYLESLAAASGSVEPYLHLAGFWIEDPDSLIESRDQLQEARFEYLRSALPQVAGGNNVAEKCAYELLNIMVKQAEPASEAHLRRAQFLFQQQRSDDRFPLSPGAAAAAVEETFASTRADKNDNDVIDGEERWHPDVPFLADLNGDDRIERGELKERLMAGDTLTRLRQAEHSVLAAQEALEQAEQELVDSLAADVLIAAADIELELAQATQFEEFEGSSAGATAQKRRDNGLQHLAEAARFSELGRGLEKPDPRSFLTSARLQLQQVAEGNDSEEAVDRFIAAEAMLKEGIEIIEGPDGESPRSESEQEELTSAEKANLFELQRMRVDVLYSLAALQDDIEGDKTRDTADGIVDGIVKLALMDADSSPSELVRFMQARKHVANLEWIQAQERLVPLVNSLPEGTPLWRRSILLLATCFEQLDRPDDRLDLFRVALQSDPLWREGLIGEAETLVELGRLDEAITSYRQLVSTPAAYQRLAGLLLLQQSKMTPDRRNWRLVENMLDAGQQAFPQSEPPVALRAELLWRIAVDSWLQGTDPGDESQRTAATALLDEAENLLREHRDARIEDAERWSSLITFVARRFDTDAATRLRRAQLLLAESVVELGDSVETRIAAVQVVVTQPAEQTVELLEGLGDETSEFSRDERYRLHVALARAYGRGGHVAQALESWEQAATVHPGSLDPRVAILQLLLIAYESAGDDEEVTIDEELWSEHFSALESIESIEGIGGEAEEIEAEAGPFSQAFKAQRVIIDVAANADLRADPAGLERALVEPRQILEEVGEQRRYWAAIPNALAIIERLLGNEAQAIAHNYRAIMDLGDRSPERIMAVAEYYGRQVHEATSTAEHDAAKDKSTRLYDLLESQDPLLLSGSLGRLAATQLLSQEQSDWAIELQEQVSELSNDPQDKILLARIKLQSIGTNQTISDRRREQELSEVEALLREAVQLDPEAPGSWTALVEYYVRRGHASDALQALQDAAERLPAEPAELKPLTLGLLHELMASMRILSIEDAAHYRDLARQFYQEALATDPDRPTLLIDVANFSRRDGDLDEAIELLDRLLDLGAEVSDEERLRARTMRAMAIAGRGTRPDTERALATLRDIVPPDDIWRVRIWRAQASVLNRRNGPDDAQAMLLLLEQIADFESLSSRERLLVAGLHEKLDDDWSIAQEYFEQLERDYPEDPAVLAALILGQLRHSQEENNLAEAEDHFEQLRALEPASFRTISIEARLATAQQQGDEAAGQLAEFVRSQLTDVSAIELIEQLDVQNYMELSQQLSDAARARGDDETLRILERSSSIDLRLLREADWLADELKAQLLRQGAVVLEELEQTNLAEDLYREFADKSERPQAILVLAQFLARHERHVESLDLCLRHWDDIPLLVVATTAVGVLRHGNMGKPEIARIATRLAQTITSDVESSEQIALLTLLADLRDQQELFDDAQSAYMRILQLDGNHVVALNNLAWLLARRGQPTMAIDLIDLAIELAGSYPELLDTKGVVYMAAGRFAEAIDALNQAIGRASTPGVHMHLAEVHWRNGENDAARQALRRAEAAGLDSDALHVLDRVEYDRMMEALAGQ